MSYFKKRSVGTEQELRPILEDLNKKLSEKLATHKEDNIKKWKVIVMLTELC